MIDPTLVTKKRRPSMAAAAIGKRGVDRRRSARSAFWNLVGTPTNFVRTVCLWTLAFVQTFNCTPDAALADGVPQRRLFVRARDPGEPLVKVENVSRVAFDYPAILIVNGGDVVGNVLALLALKRRSTRGGSPPRARSSASRCCSPR